MARYSDMRKANRERLAGMEIFEITPVILGGSPTDPENKTVLTRQQHIEAAADQGVSLLRIKGSAYLKQTRLAVNVKVRVARARRKAQPGEQ